MISIFGNGNFYTDLRTKFETRSLSSEKKKKLKELDERLEKAFTKTSS